MNSLGVELALLLLALPGSVQDIGSVTLLEESARVIRGTTVLQGIEGMRVRQGDIIENSDAGFTQLEFADGGIVALGPSSRLYLFRYGAVGKSGASSGGADFVLLSGWLKGELNSDTGFYRYESPMLAAETRNGTVVLHSNASVCEIYVESGSAAIGEVGPGGATRQATTARAEQFISRHSGGSVSILPRASSSFVESVPRPFKDTLPSRVARFAGKSIEPKPQHQVSYLEIQEWLTMPVEWRRGFVDRFEPRLMDPEFRKQIDLHVNEYPEWAPILHLEESSESPRPRN